MTLRPAENPAGNWHPLTWLSHKADCECFGLNPAARILASERVYLVPRRMMDDLRSLVAGRRIDTPSDDLAKKVGENTPKDDGTSWWLRQALDAGGTPPGARP